MNEIKIIPIGGVGTVTRNMYLYEMGEEILIVDCGIGFVDDSMPGVDLEIPDVSYLKKTNKKIVGMVLTHGHEDHIGAIPFILPQLPSFPIYGTRLTAALANEKIADFGMQVRVQDVSFNNRIKLGNFDIEFIHVTHSILDTSHPFIRTPIGNFYHGSDFKFDFTPVDGKASDLQKIARLGEEGIHCLLSDCLGSERKGHAPSERMISDSFDEEFRKAKGKIFITTYSSNISRMNQAIQAAMNHGRKVCFVGRSFLKSRDIGKKLGYMNFPDGIEINQKEVMKKNPKEVLILLAGSQAQVDSALSRVANDEHDITVAKGDTIIFSADPIPGNENNINALIDTLSKKQARVVYSEITDEFHVSGHGGQTDLELLLSLTKPKYVIPIGGTYRHMAHYKEIAQNLGYKNGDVILPETGQEVIFTNDSYRIGKKLPEASVYVDEISGEEVDEYIVHDRIKISKEGLLIILAEVSSETGFLTGKPTVITKGIVDINKDKFIGNLVSKLSNMQKGTREKNSNIIYYRKMIQKIAEEILFREKREPFVIPVIVEV